MTQCNSVNVKLSNSQLNKSKSATKNVTEVTLRLPSKMIGNSNDEINFLHKILLINICGIFVKLLWNKFMTNNLWANIKLSKTQLS